ncbi:MAG: succinylglutamate desuccinylase/aspartoacylase family protein [Verrucomicrobiota bacterium]
MSETDWKTPLKIGDAEFKPGDRGDVEIPIGHLISHELIGMTVHVLRGKQPGPRLFVSAALHGDEINGVQIARQLLAKRAINRLRGDLLVIPVVNMPAFLSRSRYLPDRRDLNRLFPGSSSGSFGARLARVFTREIVKKCTHGIDLHTGAINRPNLPQIRVSAETDGAVEMARAFEPPVILDSPTREGSLRDEMTQREKPMLLYEAGEAEILDRAAVRVGVHGVLSVMRHLGMLSTSKKEAARRKRTPMLAKSSSWERAPRGGIFTPLVEMGKAVNEGTVLGAVGDPFGLTDTEVISETEGIIIGRANQAVVDEGDGLFHIAHSRNVDRDERRIERSEEELDESFDRPVFDDPLQD